MSEMLGMHVQHAAMGQAAAGQAAAAGGLTVATSGFLLWPAWTRLEPGQPTTFSFRILDEHSGRPVTSFVEQHQRAMHLIVVRRDLSGFQHLHPTMDTDGTWMAEVTLPTAGVWRAFADFATDRGATTLGVDLLVAGQLDPVDLPAPERRATANGYKVTMQLAGQEAGHQTVLIFQVAYDGQTVTDLEPCHGACGHLVALREGDLAFLHVHAMDDATPDSLMGFSAGWPSSGRYRLFLQFQHRDVVQTVAFTLEVPTTRSVHTDRDLSSSYTAS
jgi:hypothetical protein